MCDPETDHEVPPDSGRCSCGRWLAQPDDPQFHSIVSGHIGAAWLTWAADEIDYGRLEPTPDGLRDLAALTEARASSIRERDAAAAEAAVRRARLRGERRPHDPADWYPQ